MTLFAILAALWAACGLSAWAWIVWHNGELIVSDLFPILPACIVCGPVTWVIFLIVILQRGGVGDRVIWRRK